MVVTMTMLRTPANLAAGAVAMGKVESSMEPGQGLRMWPPGGSTDQSHVYGQHVSMLK